MMLQEFNPRTGPNSLAGSAVNGLLNRDADDLTIMLRESVQNSWDARRSRNGSAKIRYSFTAISFSDEEMNAIESLLSVSEYSKAIAQELKKCPIAIEISDTDTVGLTGPTDYETDFNEQDRYRKFVFEIGNNAQGEGAGGVFGFGKSSLYNASTIGTVVIYSRVEVESGLYEDRFIIKCIWPGKKIPRPVIANNNSGVFWWGASISRPTDINNPPCILPLIGTDAVDAAKSFGMSVYGDGETGTKLLVLSPVLSGETQDSEEGEFAIHQETVISTFGVPIEIPIGNPNGKDDITKLRSELERMNRSAVHYFWARSANEIDSNGIVFKFAFRDSNGSIETFKRYDPKNILPYKYLVECLAVATGRAKSERVKLHAIGTDRPIANLGHLAWIEYESSFMDLNFLRFFDNCPSSIVLLRNVELVVQYKPVSARPKSADTHSEKHVIGVFRTLDNHKVSTGGANSKKMDVNEIFRAAENQTHGEWNHIKAGELGPYCSTYVKISLKRIDDILNKQYKPEESIDQPIQAGNALFMSHLGRFMQHSAGGSGVPGVTPPPPNTPQPSGPSHRKPVLKYVGTVESEIQEMVTRKVLRYMLSAPHNNQSEVFILPVCPDETGKMNLRPSTESDLPVEITDIQINQDNRNCLEYSSINRNGSAIMRVRRPFTDIAVDITVQITGDSRFAIEAAYTKHS